MILDNTLGFCLEIYYVSRLTAYCYSAEIKHNKKAFAV